MIKLASIFTDNMILQRKKPVTIFGKADETARITVSLDTLTVSAVISPGDWQINLPEHEAGGPFILNIVEEAADGSIMEVANLKNVMFGEVWILNGQSNIEFELRNCSTGKEELENAAFPDIRFYNVPKTAEQEETDMPAGPEDTDTPAGPEQTAEGWQSCTEGAFGEMSAIGYYMAVWLHEELKVPVGIIDCYLGGSSISCWLSEENLESCEEGKEILKEYHELVDDLTDEEYDAELAEYNAEVEKVVQSGEGDYPWPPPMGRKSLYRPCGVYKGMVLRTAPYTVKGLVYYQGEEDTDKKDKYGVLLMRLIMQYRKFWGNDLNCLIVQLPMFIEKNAAGDDRSWAEIRGVQAAARMLLPDIFTTSLIDLGEYDNVHPVDKKTPGIRIADTLLEGVYASGGASDMKCSAALRKDGKVYISFVNTYGEVKPAKNDLLDYRCETESDDEPLRRTGWREGYIYGLEASTDGEEWFVPEARIVDDKIEIADSLKVCYVRYGFFNYGRVNIYNAKDRPLMPFVIEVPDPTGPICLRG